MGTMSLFSTLFGPRVVVRVLKAQDAAPLRELLVEHAAANAFLLGWFERWGVGGGQARGFFEFVGLWYEDRLRQVALVVTGTLLAISTGDTPQLRGLVDFLHRRRAVPATIVGPDAPVRLVGQMLADAGARLRFDQPQLVYEVREAPPERWRDAWGPLLRAAAPEDIPELIDATLRMHSEETGLQTRPGDRDAFTRSTRQKVREGRAWLLRDPETGVLVFKASVSLPSPWVAQLEGIWTHPLARRRGIARSAVERLLCDLLERTPVVALQVNQDNEPGIRLYEQLGFVCAQPWRTTYVDSDDHDVDD